MTETQKYARSLVGLPHWWPWGEHSRTGALTEAELHSHNSEFHPEPGAILSDEQQERLYTNHPKGLT